MMLRFIGDDGAQHSSVFSLGLAAFDAMSGGLSTLPNSIAIVQLVLLSDQVRR